MRALDFLPPSNRETDCQPRMAAEKSFVCPSTERRRSDGATGSFNKKAMGEVRIRNGMYGKGGMR